MNDPHGICWIDGEYHLFYQHNPNGTAWSPRIHWGHATSVDLVRWRHQPIALSPHSAHEGCWTGSSAILDGKPVLYYTRVEIDDFAVGKVATAFPDADLVQWESSPDDVVVDGPPAQLHASVFRDPHLFRYGDGWTMVVGVGVPGGTGLAVQYISPDAREWSYAGVVCSRGTHETAGAWTGGMWECPQLFRVGDDWALVVSVWHDNQLFYVAGAVGSYDGSVFVPEAWSRLTYDDISYAMTSFTDSVGRACAMFWLREDAEHLLDSRAWAGALSVPMVITVGPNRTLQLQPHPDVAALRSAGTEALDSPTPVSSGADVQIRLAGSRAFRLAVVDRGAPMAEVELDEYADAVVVTRPDHPAALVPIAGDVVRVLVDCGLMEVFGGEGVAAFRLLERHSSELNVSAGDGVEVTVHQLEPAIRPAATAELDASLPRGRR